MGETVAIGKVVSIASGTTEKLKELGQLVWRYLTLSLADDRILPKKSLCVSIEKSDVFITYASRFLSRIKIRGFHKHSFGGHEYVQPEELASSTVLTVSNLFAGKPEITLIIPKAWVIISTVELPSVVRENLPEVISYELDRLTPFSSDDAYYDFRILKERDGKLTIVIAAARSDVITPYIEALREKGLSVNRVAVSLSGIGALWRRMEEKTDAVFVDVQEGGYQGALYHDGIIREAFTGDYTATDEKAKAETIMTEIESCRNAAIKDGREPRTVLLLRDTDATLKELLKLRSSGPVTILNEADIKLRLPGPRKDISYASIGGAVESLLPEPTGLNLLKKGSHEKLKPPVGVTGALLAAIIVLWIIQMLTPLRIEGKRLAEIDRQIAMKKDEIKKIEALKREIDAADKDIFTIVHFKEDRPMTLSILKELTAILPKTTWLTRVRTTETNAEIEGYASSATELLPKLEASKLFKKAEFASPTFRDARMNADRFVIKMEIEGVRKPEKEGTKNGKK